MKKIYLVILTAFSCAAAVFAQPAASGNNNISGSPFVCTAMTQPSGQFWQARVQANQNSSSATWEFPASCGYPGDVWRPYFGGSTAIAFNTVIVPNGPGNTGALYNSGNGGASGLLSPTTNGNYYTFNIENVSAGVDAKMAVLETNFNPKTISSVSNTTPANTSNSVLVTITTSAAPSSGEYFYVRYSTDITFASSSAISLFTFNGTTGQALIPCQAAGPVYYYIFSSNQTSATITASVGTNGRIAYDLLTLKLNNNGGGNYAYTQGSGTNFGGIYSVPSSCYATVSAFVTALNAGTVTAPVTCYAIGGSPTETATAGGISITQTGTLANPIVFQKFGSGNYTIQASNALTAGNINDAIIKLIGSDYITIDGFTLQENAANTINTPAASNNMTEWGIALLRSNTADGAQNNTIQNNNISLNNTYRNTWGIYSSSRHTATAVTTAVDATATTGANSNNKFYANTISNSMMGIAVIGSATAAFQDVGNDVGGSSAATGNTITGWGGNFQLSSYAGNTGTYYCILMNHQTGDNVSYNTMTSTSISGGNATVRAINKDYITTAPTGTFTSTISNNTITITNGNLSGNFRPIESQGMGTLSTATININNNIVQNCTANAATSTNFIGIANSSAPGILSMTNNIVRGYTSAATTGGFNGIQNTGAVVTTINISNNKIGDAVAGAATFTNATTGSINAIQNTAGSGTAALTMNNNSFDGFSLVSMGQIMILYNTGGVGTININSNKLGTTTGTLINFSAAQTTGFFGIYNAGGLAAGTSSILNNDITGINFGSPASCSVSLIVHSPSMASQTVSNNTFTNLNLNTSNQVALLNRQGAMTSGQSWTCNNNSIVGTFNKSGAGSSLLCMLNSGSSANGSTETENNNNFSNITAAGNTSVVAWYNVDGVSNASGPAKVMTGNTFSNISSVSGAVTIFTLDKSASLSLSSNTVSNISSSSSITGVNLLSNNGQGSYSINSNTFSGLQSTGSNVVGISNNSASIPTLDINDNTFSSLSSTGASSSVYGISIAAGQTVNIYNNQINSLSGSGTTNPFVYGILSQASGSTVNIYKNKVYGISETGNFADANPAVHGIYIGDGTTANVYNNFIADLTAPNINASDAIRGITIASTTANTAYNLYYNSIYLNAASTNTNFGTSGVYHTTSATATTAQLNMIDNIIVNTSTPGGAGVTAAYRRSNATLTNYASTSDYNLFYAGSPSATRLIFYDGTNSDLTLAAYKTRVTPRDANSISVMPAFTSNIDLHLTGANCSIDGSGTPVSVLNDIDNTVRDAATPDMGADEFTATYNNTLAGVAGSAVCENKTVSASGTTYTSNCDLIAKVLPSGGAAVGGKINVCVTKDATQQFHNAEPYVQRHFDIEPATGNTTTTSATITLYFTDAEFVQFNTNNPAWPKLPTAAGGGSADPNRANLKVTQYHGTATTSPSTPGNYSTGATGVYIDPPDANIVWNGSYWAVTFSITGFSGFYVHTNPQFPLPVTFNYLKGVKQDNKNLLTWSVTCNTTPRVTFTLERSTDQRNFSAIYSTSADAARCAQPFDYTDVQPLAGINYYRLKIADIDGRITYSNIVAIINGTKGYALMNINPNPVKGDVLKLSSTSASATKIELLFTDVQGRVMKRETLNLIAGSNVSDINVANFAPGTYNVYGMLDGERSAVLRFVKE